MKSFSMRNFFLISPDFSENLRIYYQMRGNVSVPSKRNAFRIRKKKNTRPFKFTCIRARVLKSERANISIQQARIITG